MQSARELFEEFKCVHGEVLSASDAFEAILAMPKLDSPLLASVRRRLAQSSGKRRILLDRMIAMLGDLPPPVAARVREVRAKGIEDMLRASRHIGIWTTQEVTRNWEGYVAASRSVPDSMRAGVAAEREVIYPLAEVMLRSAA